MINTKFRIWDDLYEVFFYGDFYKLVFGKRQNWRNTMMLHNPEGTRCSTELSISTSKYIEAAERVIVSSLRMDDAQFWTGKQDKDKNDIYVGDIVSVRGAAAQVKFGNFESETNKVYGSAYYLVGPEVFPEPLYITKDLSVIGNIYQSPELLEKHN